MNDSLSIDFILVVASFTILSLLFTWRNKTLRYSTAVGAIAFTLFAFAR